MIGNHYLIGRYRYKYMTMFNINDPENYNDGYYHVSKDVKDYPDATVFVIWSRRGPGKTYSSLRYPYHPDDREPFKTIYLKRTAEDVRLICTYDGDSDLDPSPWKKLNMDFGIDVKPKLLTKKSGIGAFYNTDENGNPSGKVINYLLALNSVKTVKGIDFSDAEWIIFDEFIPQPGEVIKRAEGIMLLNFFETVNRDRRKRGKPGLKLILMANAEDISTPVTDELDIIDHMADMQAKGIDKLYLKDRRIFLHHISEDECPRADKNLDMEAVMRGTAFAARSYEGKFTNDFSAIKELSIKGMRCLYHLHYKLQKDAYIYMNPKTGLYYMSHIKGNAIQHYDLDRENQQKRFHLEHGIRLKEACINDRFLFERYTYYDLIINFTKIYNL